ncbi:MAG: acetyltransferase [Leptonema illini]|uniref:Acetyltransferase n=1 Tax=Leptonema illini TaxID=183 RepID=A0A833H336_9LEPT|nr:MAG: acetyltransferase [Leptonema illini]
MKKVVIFGTGDIAEIAAYLFQYDAMYEVAAFTVDRDYLKSDRFCEKPVVAFEDLGERFLPSEYEVFVALSYTKMNKIREQKFLQVKEKGYRCATYISPRATVYHRDRIGENCFIFEDNTVQPFVQIGNNVTLWSGNHIGHHSVIEDNVFISSHVVVSGGVTVGRNTFIGVNSTLRDHIKIAPECMIGAGALILADTTEKGVYIAQEAEKLRATSDRLRKI